MDVIERRKEELREIASSATEALDRQDVQTRREELLRAVERELTSGGLLDPASAGGAPASGASLPSAPPDAPHALQPAAAGALGTEHRTAAPGEALPHPAPDFDLSNEEWEALWEENQDDLERNIGILNDDHFLAEVVNRGTNLQQFAEEKAAALREKEEESVEDYIHNATRFATLYSEISECEGMLDSIRNVVWGFRGHLDSITGDIRSLQKRSAEITECIKNRENALLHLSPVLQKVDVITPEWLSAIEKAPIEAPDGHNRADHQREVDMAFLSAIRQLDEKLNFLAEDPHLQDSVMQQQLQPKLLAAAKRVSGKVEKFLRAKLDGFREGTSLVMQQQALAHRCSFAFRFLRQYNQQAAEGIVGDYIDSTAKTYLKLVKKLSASTQPEVKLAKQELVVPKEAFDAKKGVESDGKKLLKKVTNITQRDRVHIPCEQRKAVLSALVPDGDTLVVDPSVMVAQRRTCVEDFVRVNAVMINAAVHEACFMSEFFAYPSARRDTMTSSVFEKAFAYVQERTNEALSAASDDHISIVLLLRVCECMFSHLLPNRADKFHSDPNALKSTLVTSRASTTRGTTGEGVAQRSQNRAYRSPNFLTGHLKDVQARLWGAYSSTVGAHVASVRDAADIAFAPAKLGNARSVEDCIRSYGPQLGVHGVVRRYMELACDLHTLNTTPMVGSRVTGSSEGSAIFSDAIVADLATLRKELLRLVEGLANRYAAVQLTPLVFTANNLSAVIQSFAEARVSSSYSEDPDAVDSFLRERVAEFAEQEMRNEMSQLCTVVRSAVVMDASDEQGFAKNRSAVDGNEVASVVNWFHGQWPQLLARAAGRVGVCFTNQFTAQYVLRCVFAKLIEYNEQLRALVFKLWSEPPCRTKLVSKEVIVHEVTSKYMPSF